MSLLSRFKRGPRPAGSGHAALIEQCRKIADGDISLRLNEADTDPQRAELAAAVNAALSRAEKRVTGLESGIGRATELLGEFCNGNFEVRALHIDDRDPSAAMLNRLNDFADVTDAFVREAGASLDSVSRNIYFRKVMETGLRGEFQRTAKFINHATSSMGDKVDGFTALTERLVENIQSVASSISDMHGSVTGVSEIADDASQRSATVAAAVEQTTTSLQSIAAAAEEMLVSAQEINRQVVHSTDITQDATQRMTESNAVAQTLLDAANSINEVLDLISKIASQTNLLALNATIESARAGDAGKGFAVVANEVKSLSGQTAKATKDISEQVEAVQNATNATVETIERLGGTVTEINEIAEAIASAITQQEATTKEISANIQNAAAGSQEVADNMQQVSSGARNNSEAADALQITMSGIEEASRNLVAEATDFLESSKRTGTD